MRNWWFSCKAFTCLVVSDENNLVTQNSAPAVQSFVGQHIKELADWCKVNGNFRWEKLKGV